MTSFELREEIDHGGKKYFLQTSLLQKKGVIQSSFFKDGVLFDTVQTAIDGKGAPDDVRRATKEAHLENKQKFMLILGVSERIRSSEDPKPHLKIAQALFKRHLYQEAIQEAQKAIKKGNKDSLSSMIVGESYYEMGDFERAFEATRAGIEVTPDYPDMHNLLGKVYLKQQKCKPAIECFKRAIELNLYYGESYLNLARAYLLNTIVKEDYELSRELESTFLSNLERAEQLDPYLMHDRLEEARSLFREKDYDGAYGILESAKQLSARGGIDDIILDLYMMLLYDGEEFQEGEIERYLDRVREIVDQNPTFADGYNSLGILYTAKCKIYMDRASKAFRKALEINTNYQKAQKNLRLSENDRQGIFILLKALLD
ncbi:MAG: tetratricopeptide repeat protein [Candidatus Krumholzibacteriia bacterium]